MNKFIRIMLIMFGVCLAVGGGLLIAGLALGGTLDDAAVSIGSDGHLVTGLMDHGLLRLKRIDDDDDDSADQEEFTNKMSVSAADIRELKIDLRNCDLRIAPSDDDKIYVGIEAGDADHISLKRDEDVLKIIDTRKHFKNLKTVSVDIRIPDDHMFDEISMQLRAGDIGIDRLAANEIEIKAGAGQMDVETLIAKQEFDLELGAGDMEIGEAELGRTDIECGVGSFEIISCTLGGDANINGGVGEVNVGIAGEKDDFNYELQCGLGELEVFGDSYTSLGKDKKIDNGARYTIALECGVGSVNVHAR